MRRFLGLLTMLSMLHLLLAGRGSACSSHHGDAAASAGLTSAMSVAMAAATSAATPAASTHHESGTGSPSDCTTTNGARCCDALGSCTLAVASAASVRAFSDELFTARAVPHTPDDLDSVWTSPEPPPPKA